MAEGGNNLWPDLVAHPDYDEFWQSRDIRRHLPRRARAPARNPPVGRVDDVLRPVLPVLGGVEEDR